MSDFDARIFPYVFSCRCGNEQTVTREECINYAGHLSRPAEAAEFTLRHLHGWVRRDRTEMVCSECARPDSATGGSEAQRSLWKEK